MTPAARLVVVIVRDARTDAATALAARLRAEGRDVDWRTPRDLDLVNAAVRGGGVATVIVSDAAILLEGIWRGVVSFDAWQHAGVGVEVLGAPGERAQDMLATVFRAWTHYVRNRRRRQLIAALVLSLAAVLAVFLIVRYAR